MDKTVFYAALVAVGIGFVVWMRRRHRDLREYLEPPLRDRGMEYVRSDLPAVFNVGPFPKFEVQMGRPISRAGGISGEYSEYRIVTFMDPQQKTHQLWACVEFEVFRFRRTRWRATAKNELPPAILEMLEG